MVNRVATCGPLAVESKVIAAIKSRLLENGIDLPFPTQHVLFHDQIEETDGDRSRQRDGWPPRKGPVAQPHATGTALGWLAETPTQTETS